MKAPAPATASALRRGVITSAISVVVGVAATPYLVLRGWVQFLQLRGVLRAADAVVLLVEGGFGHTVTAPDVLRRLHPGKRCVAVVAPFVWGRHNPRLALLWPDVVQVFIPANVELRWGGSSWASRAPGPLASWLAGLARRAVARWARPGCVLYHDTTELYRALVAAHAPDDASALPDHLRWPIAYFRLSQRVPGARLRLPEVERSRIEAVLGPVRAGRKLCAVYLRRKGEGAADVSSARRVGSPFPHYVPLLDELGRRGYTVLLLGETPSDPATRRLMAPHVLDAARVGVEKEWFDLFASTEVEFFIGEQGGGIWLPGINGIPRLVMNAFPYYFGVPLAAVCYKTVRDRSGSRVDPRLLFQRHAYDYELAGMSVECNDAAQLLAAGKAFLEHPPDASAQPFHLMAQGTWAWHACSEVSPAFLAQFEASPGPLRAVPP